MDGLPALVIGRAYPARVEEIFADGRVLLAVEGLRIPALAETAVVLGETVRVEVDQLVPRVVLRVKRQAREG